LLLEVDEKIVVVIFVTEVLGPFGSVGKGGDGGCVRGDSWALVACVVVIAGLEFGRCGAEGEEGEEVVDDVVMKLVLIEENVMLLVILLQQFAGLLCRLILNALN